MIPLGMYGAARPVASGGGGPATVTYRTAVASDSNAVAYTFPTIDIGSASSGREVIVATTTRKAAPSATVSSVTIGGVSAVQDAERYNPFGNSIAIWRAAVPSGTTADVVVTWSTTVLRCGLGVWTTDAPVQVLAIGDSVASSDISITVASSPDGFLIASTIQTSGANPAVSGVTQRYSGFLGGEVSSHAGGDAVGTGSNMTVGRSSGTDPVLLIASYEPL